MSISIEQLMTMVDKPLREKTSNIAAKERILKQLNDGVKMVEKMKSVDELNYGSVTKPYINSKGEKIGNKSWCWSNKEIDGVRGVRMMIANSIVTHNKSKIMINVDNTLEGVLGGLNRLIEMANGVSTKDWEIIWEEMLEIREKKKAKAEAKANAKNKN